MRWQLNKAGRGGGGGGRTCGMSVSRALSAAESGAMSSRGKTGLLATTTVWVYLHSTS
jgi:hypothetical protein